MKVNDASLFFCTRTNRDSLLEKAGNFCLNPCRYLWNGMTIFHFKIDKTPLEMLTFCLARDEDEFWGKNKFAKVILGILLIVGIVPGILLKGAAHLSKIVRDHHQEIKQSFKSPQITDPSITLRFDEPPEKHDFDPKDSYRYHLTVIIDVSECLDDNCEKYICQKLASLVPNALYRGATIWWGKNNSHREFQWKKECDLGYQSSVSIFSMVWRHGFNALIANSLSEIQKANFGRDLDFRFNAEGNWLFDINTQTVRLAGVSLD